MRILFSQLAVVLFAIFQRRFLFLLIVMKILGKNILSGKDVDAKSHRTVKKVVKNQFEKNICPGCDHCGICIKACPVQAIYKDPKTGFVLTDKEKCIGCHACEKVCPKDVIHFDKDGKMEKCDGCIERIREGREPACVRVCFPGAITLE